MKKKIICCQNGQNHRAASDSEKTETILELVAKAQGHKAATDECVIQTPFKADRCVTRLHHQTL